MWGTNDIIDNTEKWGAALRRESQMEAFRDTLEICQLNDLGFIGPKFTWTNGRDGHEFTKERLDRALGNMEWCNTFIRAEVHILEARSSDHKPLLVQFDGAQKLKLANKRGFRFEASWALDDDYKEVVREAWGARRQGHDREVDMGNQMAVLCTKLQQCSVELKTWSLE